MTEATIAAGRRRNRGPLDPNRAAYIFYPLLAAAVILPVCWALFGGFKSSSELFAFPPTIWPHHWTMQNFTELFVRLNFGHYIWNSVVVAFWTVLLTLFFGGLAGYALSRWDFRLRDVLLVLLLGLQLIPSSVKEVPSSEPSHLPGLLMTATA